MGWMIDPFSHATPTLVSAAPPPFFIPPLSPLHLQFPIPQSLPPLHQKDNLRKKRNKRLNSILCRDPPRPLQSIPSRPAVAVVSTI